MDTSYYQEIPAFVPSKRPQYIAALAATIGAFGTGNMLGWTSPGIPNLEESEKLGILTEDQKSWIGSSAMLGALVAGFAAGFSIERIGRKLTLISLSVPFVLGWILMGFANNLAMLISGRFITGFAGGAFTLVVPVYISEICEDSIRGTLGNGMVLVLVTGILFTYAVGSGVSWTWLSLISAFIPVIFLCCIIFMPDSPRYLLIKGEHEKAGRALKWLRGATDIRQIEPELKEIQSSIDSSNDQTATFRDLFYPAVLKPVGISMMLMLIQQLGGINAVIFYSVEIFQSAGSDIDPNVSAIIIGGVQVVFVLISTILVDKAGRKILLVISAAGMSISLVALGVFFYLKDVTNDRENPEGLGWLPLVSLIAYIISYNLGLGPLPWLMMSELVPQHVKGLASAIATSFNWFLAFLVTMTFTDLKTWLGSYGCYWLFAAISGGGSIFALLFVPETKGKSLDEIQSLFT